MQRTDAAKFAAIMTRLCLTFDKALTADLTQIYFEALADLSIETVDRAAALSVKTCTFFPKPAELRSLVEGDASDKAQAAWNLFEEAVCRVGYTKSLWVEDHALASAIRLTFGGWEAACTAFHPVYAAYDADGNDTVNGRQVGGLSPEMIASKRKEFVANYRNAKREQRPVDRYLVGATESHNRTTSIRRGAFPTKQGVGLITCGEVRIADLSFESGQLESGARQMLEQGHLLLPAPKPKMLTAKPDPAAPTMNLDEAIGTKDETLIGLEMLRDGLPERFKTKRVEPKPLSAEEIEARRRLLREQAARIMEDEKRDSAAVS